MRKLNGLDGGIGKNRIVVILKFWVRKAKE